MTHEEHVELAKYCSALFEDNMRLRRLVATSLADGMCPWCERMNKEDGTIEHRRSCAAFTPDGQVK